MEQETYFTVAELAGMLRVRPETVLRWLKNKQITGTRVGPRGRWRIPFDEVARVGGSSDVLAQLGVDAINGGRLGRAAPSPRQEGVEG